MLTSIFGGPLIVDHHSKKPQTLTIAKVRHVPYRESKLSLGANGNWEMDLEYPTNSCFLIIYNFGSFVVMGISIDFMWF